MKMFTSCHPVCTLRVCLPQMFVAAVLSAIVLGAAAAQAQPQSSPAAVTRSFTQDALSQDEPSNGQTLTTSRSPKSIRAGHILVRFKESTRQDVLNQLRANYGANVVTTISAIKVTHFQTAGSGLALLEHLRNRPVRGVRLRSASRAKRV